MMPSPRNAAVARVVLVTCVFVACSGAPAGRSGGGSPAGTSRAQTPSATAAAPSPSSTAISDPSPATAVVQIREYPVPGGSHPHDVAPAHHGGIWYTAQATGELGLLDPATGSVKSVALGAGSAPHGVIVGPEGDAWVTDSGLNAIVRVDGTTHAVKRYPLPARAANANLNTAAFDGNGVLWFTGQNGWYGRLDVASGRVEVFEAPKGRGPYGISTAPDGTVAYSSLAGSYIGFIDSRTGRVRAVDTARDGAGARRIWFDTAGNAWITEWFAGNLAMYANGQWRQLRLPGSNPQPYAVYVDERDDVWVTDFGSNAIVRFDPDTNRFESFPLPSSNAAVRQLLGRPGEVWGAESGTDKLVVLRTRP